MSCIVLHMQWVSSTTVNSCTFSALFLRIVVIIAFHLRHGKQLYLPTWQKETQLCRGIMQCTQRKKWAWLHCTEYWICIKGVAIVHGRKLTPVLVISGRKNALALVYLWKKGAYHDPLCLDSKTQKPLDIVKVLHIVLTKHLIRFQHFIKKTWKK